MAAHRRLPAPDLALPPAVAAALAAGAGPAALAGYGETALVGAGLASLFVVLAAIAAPGPLSAKAGVLSGAIVLVGLALANLTAGAPVASGVAMGLVAVATGAALAGGKATAAAGMVLGSAYFAAAALGLTVELSLAETLELGGVGIAGGLVLVGLVALVPALRRGASRPRRPSGAGPEGGPGPGELMWASIRGLGPEVRFGLRRGLLLGTAMGVYQATEDHNVFWVMLTIFIVLQPGPAATASKALRRSLGTIAGALTIAILAQIVPAEAIVAIGIAALALSTAWYRSSYTIYVAGLTIMIVALFGAQDESFLTWAGLRLADTALGTAIALLATFVVLPAPRPHRDQPPSRGPTNPKRP